MPDDPIKRLQAAIDSGKMTDTEMARALKLAGDANLPVWELRIPIGQDPYRQPGEVEAVVSGTEGAARGGFETPALTPQTQVPTVPVVAGSPAAVHGGFEAPPPPGLAPGTGPVLPETRTLGRGMGAPLMPDPLDPSARVFPMGGTRGMGAPTSGITEEMITGPVPKQRSLEGLTEMERVDAMLENTEIEDKMVENRFPSAAMRKGLSVPPKITNSRGEIFTPGAYHHFEPSEWEVKKWASEQPGGESRVMDVEKNGKDSETWKRFADAKWKHVSEAHRKYDIPAIRVEFLDPESVGEYTQKALGEVGGRVTAGLKSADDMVSWGAAHQALLNLHSPSPAEQELISKGIIKNQAERLKDIQHKFGVSSFIGGMAGLIAPTPHKFIPKGGLTGALIKPAEKLMRKGERVQPWGTRALRSAAAGGGIGFGMGLGMGGVEAAGQVGRGEKPLTLEEVGQKATAMGTVGALATPALESLFSLGRAYHGRMRNPATAEGENLQQLEKAQGAGSDFWRIFKPSKKYRETREERLEVHMDEVSKMAIGEIPPIYQNQTDLMIAENVPVGMKKTVKYVADKVNGMLRENEGYYGTPEGQEKIVPKFAIEKCKELLTRSRAGAGPIPYVDPKMYTKTLRDLTRVQVVPREIGARAQAEGATVLTPEEVAAIPDEVIAISRPALPRLGEIPPKMLGPGHPALPTGPTPLAVRPAPLAGRRQWEVSEGGEIPIEVSVRDIPYPETAAGEPVKPRDWQLKWNEVVVKWQGLTAQKFDMAVRGLDDMLRAEQNKIGGPPGRVHQSAQELQAAWRKDRDKFLPNEYAPESLKAVVQSLDEGPIEVSGWSALKHRQHETLNDIESTLLLMGTPGAKRLEATNMQQWGGAFNAFKGLADRPHPEQVRRFEEIFQDYPAVREDVLEMISSGAYAEMMAGARGGMRGTVSPGSGRPGVWATTRLGRHLLRLDPAFTGLMRSRGKGLKPGLLGAQRQYEIGTAAEQAGKMAWGAGETAADVVGKFIEYIAAAVARGVLPVVEERKKEKEE